MSKLVDKERLAKLAAALDARAKAAVKAEEERAKLAEAGLQTDINTKVDQSAYDAKVKALADEDARIAGLVATEATARENADNDLDARLKEVEEIIGDGSSGSLGDIVQQVNTNKNNIATLKGTGEGSVAKAVADAKKEIVDAQKEINDDIKGRMETVEAFVGAQPAKDQAQDAKIQALEAKFTGDNSVEKQIAAAQAAAEAKAAELDKTDRDAQTLVDAEQDRRLGVLEAKFEGDQSVEAQIAAAEARAKKHAEDKDAADRTAQATKDKAQDDRLADLEAFEEAHTHEKIEQDIAANTAKLAGLEKATVKAEIQAAQSAAEAKAAELDATLKSDLQQEIDDDVKVVADELAKQKDAAQAGTLANQIKVEKERMDAFLKDANVQQGAVDTLKELQEYINTHGQAAQKMVDDIAANKTAIETEVTRATKKEGEIEQALTNAIAKEVTDRNAAIKVVSDALADEKNAAKDGSLAKQIADEVTRAKTEEANIRADFAAEDKKLADQIKAVEEIIGVDSGDGEVGAFAQVQADIAALKGTVGDAEEGLVKDVADLQAADVELQNNIDLKVEQSAYNTKVQALEKADTDLGTRIAAFEAGGAQDVAAKETRLAAAEKDIDDLQAFVEGHEHTSLQQAIQANANAITAETKKDGARDVAIKAAVDKEVEARNAAIATALEAYSTTEQMKAILTNVVATLNLSIANDKLVLKLGGTEGVTLSETTLDMVTEDEIDKIIAGLDTPAAE